MIFIFVILSIVYYSPVWFVNRIKVTKHVLNRELNLTMGVYDTENAQFGKSVLGKRIIKYLSLIRITLVIFVLLLLNILALIKYSIFKRVSNQLNSNFQILTL